MKKTKSGWNYTLLLCTLDPAWLSFPVLLWTECVSVKLPHESKTENPCLGASRPMCADELPPARVHLGLGGYFARYWWSLGWAGDVPLYLWDAPKNHVSGKSGNSGGGKAKAHLGKISQKSPFIQAYCVKYGGDVCVTSITIHGENTKHLERRLTKVAFMHASVSIMRTCPPGSLTFKFASLRKPTFKLWSFIGQRFQRFRHSNFEVSNALWRFNVQLRGGQVLSIKVLSV